ncbi:uncharacterized protein LOC130448879 [Diorhabda sublineata]|uniref:uncharacterized protein LOC130448879 n=1 Tax=Diorhabda sublineata TaxID=1163346 RepID=UPI0024E1399D|nr:uncharacterized protein LOC130448879 [Diorhabda sublineata]XP_056642425.1 uncharacterized protein LOC130448879 [Diorhabda sublineata]
MRKFLCIIVMIATTNSNLVCEKNKEFSKLISQIRKQKETISDTLLKPYGDVVEQFQKLLDKLGKYISTAANNLNELERNTKNISNKTNLLNIKRNEFYDELIELEKDLANFRILGDLSIDGIKNNTDRIEEIIENLKDIENELEYWNNFADNYNETNLYNNIMNIPHSVSEDLSFIENAMYEDDNITCTYMINEDLKFVFEQLATLLDFTEVAKDVEDLKIIAEKNRLAVNAEIEMFKQLVDKEKEARMLVETGNRLEDLLDQLNDVLYDLNINKLSEIDSRIEQTENQIENNHIKTNCYMAFLQNCHIQQPNTLSEPLECIDEYCNKQ